MITILLKCDFCKREYDIDRDRDVPERATSISCNWCPKCEENAKEYYEEKYNFDDPPDYGNNPNQIELFNQKED